ncbi:MAG: UDP-N-acetylglucosamine--N-acetylmuramyl-(pentapeptide) pyrophosphoryl-undecaprenol N-acetylglucosamine transferase [Candidatus Pacebacteria bacterium]|nr:UDP-N-acetylglucosamine--N-acetylmuramyl-(pentapeptide) pyrophosphoryl-undecaprenol N-acetylglucosamine transferase [Candidatus Paceibacterota bacterium]
MRIVFVAGGTGGHFYPLMAIADAVYDVAKEKKIDTPELYYMGPDTYDEAALTARSIRFIACPAGKRRRYFSPLNILDFFKTSFGILVALWKLFILYPDVVMSKGSYTSVPVTIAAGLLRIPIVVHESDAVAGSANRIGGLFARYIAISYNDAITYFPESKTAFTGIPMRKKMLAAPVDNLHERLGIDASRPVIVVLGGSQGAERVNKLILETLDELLPEYTIIHQTGKASFDVITETAKTLITDTELLRHYHPVAFMSAETLNMAMHSATIIVSRAGSTGIHEIAVKGKPAILIPIPEDVSHDQRTNAYAYARTGAAVVMEEQNLTDGLLTGEITRIMSDPMTYRSMSEAAIAFAPRQAAHMLASTLLEIGLEHT